LQAYERAAAEGQIAGLNGQREMSAADDASALAPVTWEEIGETSPSRGRPHSNQRTFDTGSGPYNGLASSARPLPVARNQSITPVLGAASRAQSGYSAEIYALQYAPSREPNESSRECSDPRLIRRPVNELRPHPAYLMHAVAASTSKIDELERVGSRIFNHPIMVTQDGLIIDGYARWELAKRWKMVTILCLVYEMSPGDALCEFIWAHKPVRGLSKFRLIELSAELQCYTTEEGSLDQPPRDRETPPALESCAQLDSVKQRARVVGVSLASVRKVDYVLTHGCASTIQAARDGRPSIHRAALWSQESDEQQLENLKQLHIKRLKQKTRYLLRRILLSRSKTHELELSPATLITQLGRLSTMSPRKAKEFGPVTLARLGVPGMGIYLTEELFQALKPDEEVLLE